jgi:hypothetical protein
MFTAHTHLFHFNEERNSKWRIDILVKVGNWNQHLIICQVQLVSWNFLYPISWMKHSVLKHHKFNFFYLYTTYTLEAATLFSINTEISMKSIYMLEKRQID